MNNSLSILSGRGNRQLLILVADSCNPKNAIAASYAVFLSLHQHASSLSHWQKRDWNCGYDFLHDGVLCCVPLWVSRKCLIRPILLIVIAIIDYTATDSRRTRTSQTRGSRRNTLLRHSQSWNFPGEGLQMRVWWDNLHQSEGMALPHPSDFCHSLVDFRAHSRTCCTCTFWQENDKSPRVFSNCPSNGNSQKN